MNLSTLHCQVTLALTVLFSLYSIASSEIKGPGAVKMCGDDFFNTFKFVCAEKFRQRRSIQQPVAHNDITPEAEKFPIIKERLARQFLRRIRRVPRGLRANAIEECCVESCTIEEVREYPCN